MLTSIQDIRMLMITFPKKIRKRERENRLNLIRKAHNEKKEDVIRTDRMEDYLGDLSINSAEGICNYSRYFKGSKCEFTKCD